MNQALLYSKYNGLQKNDATFVLKNYLHLIKWSKEGEDAILDVGCGAGDVMYDLLLPLLPKNIGKLVAVDISEEMIEFAKTKYQNSKVSFKEMNIGAEDIPVDFEESFDHIFSFYCLHWVQNQRKALTNIMQMLKPGGDMLLTFLANNPIFDIYEALAKKGRWEAYMENFKKYISPYQYSKNPDKEFREILEEVGFEIDLCKVEERNYVYPSVAVLKKSITAVSPFYNKIPENLQADYLTDYMSEMQRLNLVDRSNNNNEDRIQVLYKLFIIHASKRM